jgi:UDP-N-acetylglucosamine--N-acetylmuramyl-(pentapeptide) pyrophosphoryl-undecaprenol N-acetylglucosamine transferase
MELKKLLLTGSHAGSTAIAVIEEIKKRNINVEIHWIGKKYAEEGKDTKTLEYNNLTKYGVIFHNLETGKIQTKFTKFTIPALLKIPSGFIKGYKLIKEIKPDLTFSFGSAAGAISVFWSSFLGIPSIIHEQTATAGRANIISSYFAKKVLISRETSAVFFNKLKTELVGNPINSNFKKYIGENRNTRIKSILVTGGSRGSTWLNDAILPIIPQLLGKYYLMHQTGESNLNNMKSEVKLGESVKDRYLAFGQIDPVNMAEVFSKADLVIARSGANTTSEILALKKPCILVPIPWTYNDEQQKNAEYLEKLGLATILLQKELTPQKLLFAINKIVDNYQKIIKSTEDIESPDLLAQEKIVDEIEKFI